MSDVSIDDLFAQATAHHQAGRLPDADALYRQILVLDPAHEPTLLMLGVLAHQIGRNDVAGQLLTRAIQLNPANPDAHNNLGVVFAATGAHEQAIAAYQAAISLRADDARAYNNLGSSLREVGRLTDAIAAYSRAAAIAPDYPEAHDNLGLALQEAGDLSGAVIAFRRAVQLSPTIAEFHVHLASALRESGDLDSAIAAARQALSLDASSVPALVTLGSALKDLGLLDEAIAYLRRAASLPGGSDAADALLLAIHYHPDFTPRQIADEHARWAAQFALPSRAYRNDKTPDRPLHIGYVSPDFRHHVVGYNILPLFQHHDRSRFKVFCYSNSPRPDDLTARFHSLSDQWRDIKSLSDQSVADLIEFDGIDILVDLALHTTGNRLGVFAAKPAPIQTIFAGYPGATGLAAIDYRLTDPHLDPPGGNDALYRERGVRLPHSFWCYQPFVHDVPVNAPPAASSGNITFGYLGAFAKINIPTLDLWSIVLAAIPASRMVLMARPCSARSRTLAHFAARGISSERIDFVDYQPREQYLRTYHRIDIVLDTFPYNGHTTNLDALWMGVPVVTLFGETPVSRAGLSQLSNLGLEELATPDRDQFVSIATTLAKDRSRLADLRKTLRPRIQHSPLTDARGFARGIETAYCQMWRDWCNPR